MKQDITDSCRGDIEELSNRIDFKELGTSTYCQQSQFELARVRLGG